MSWKQWKDIQLNFNLLTCSANWIRSQKYEDRKVKLLRVTTKEQSNVKKIYNNI